MRFWMLIARRRCAQKWGYEMLNICDHPVIIDRINQMRDVSTTPAQFRTHLRQVAMYLTMEATKNLPTKLAPVTTPLETVELQFLENSSPVLISILRAGNGLLDGALDVLPSAKVGFLGMFRDEETLQPVNYYANLPNGIESSPVLLLDPMLATGRSALDAVKQLKSKGAQDIRLVCLVAAPEGIATIQQYDKNVTIYCGAVDRELNKNGYIVPGLGDAGDRIFNSH